MRHYPITVVKRRGFTALELIIVLVVGFSIIALSASKMGQLFSASSTAAAMSSLLELYSSARSLRGNTGYGTADSPDLMQLLIDANMVPKGLAISGEGVQNEWGGKIDITRATGEEIGFSIMYPKVPSDACLKLVQNLTRSGNFVGIKVGEGEPLDSQTSVVDIVKACTPKDKAKAVNLEFQFRE